MFWCKVDEGYVYRSMFFEMFLLLDWFVDVNYYEVKVFCNYKSEKIG